MASLISAGVYFSDLNSKYNLGDIVELTININPTLGDRLLKVNLLCEGNNIIEFNNFPDENGNVNLKLPLNQHTIKEANGRCYFLADYSGDKRKSNEFEISKLLIVKLSTDSFFSNPGDSLIISGSAAKVNGNPVNGELELDIPLLNLLQSNQQVEVKPAEATNKSEITESNESKKAKLETKAEVASFSAGKFYGKIDNGAFSVNIKLPDKTPAGSYRIDILAYEKYNEEKTSEGLAMATLNVFQILSGIDIAINNQNFNPGSYLDIKPILLDQAGRNIEDEVSILIRKENGERFFEKIVNSKDTSKYEIPANLSSGYYEIVASSGDKSAFKKFFVNEKAIASFQLLNGSLVVTNIGNIPYKKDIEVELNGKPFIKSVSLGLGESKKFRLTGSNEEYTIKVSDGESEIIQGGVILTGRSISVSSINEEGLLFNKPVTWIIAALILVVGLLFLFKNIFKKRSFAYHLGESNSNPMNSKDNIEYYAPKKMSQILPNKPEANQVLVLKGHKSKASVLALKIKKEIGSQEKELLEKLMVYIYEKKGAVYEQDNFIFAVFSPLMTRTNKNESLAVRAAAKITNALNEHNEKFKNNINFGIGVNSGGIINVIEKGKLKFTALGNFIIAAKKLAESSNNKTILTKEAYEKCISEVKSDKLEINGKEVYEVKNIVDRDKNKEFISGFLERQRKEFKR